MREQHGQSLFKVQKKILSHQIKEYFDLKINFFVLFVDLRLFLFFLINDFIAKIDLFLFNFITKIMIKQPWNRFG